MQKHSSTISRYLSHDKPDISMTIKICRNCHSELKAGAQLGPHCGLILPTAKESKSKVKSKTNAGSGRLVIVHERYKLDDTIAEGKFIKVFSALDHKLNRKCIVSRFDIKKLEKENVTLLEKNAARLAQLSHPNISMLLDHFHADGYFYLVEENFSGMTLNELLNLGKTIKRDKVIAWIESICAAVAYLNRQALVLCFLCPDIVLISEQGNLKITHLYRILAMQSAITDMSVTPCCPAFAAPEALAGKPVIQSDVYSIGAITFCLFTGLHYNTVPSSSVDIFAQSRRKLSENVQYVIAKALSAHLDDRYSSVHDFIGALHGNGSITVADKAVAQSTPPQKGLSVPKRSYPAKKWLIAIGAASSLLILGLIAMVTSGQKDHPWPMPGQNAQHTCFSPYNTGNNRGVLKWSYKFDDASIFNQNAPIIDSDETIYVNNNNLLYSINSYGKTNWRTVGHVVHSPSIVDNEIYALSGNNLQVISLNGRVLKESKISDNHFLSSPIPGSNGDIYIMGCARNLFAVTKDGNVKWSFKGGCASCPMADSPPAISRDGTIYTISCSPSRTAYELVALSPAGKKLWAYVLDNGRISTPVVDSVNESVCFVAIDGAKQWLYSIDRSGKNKWAIELEGNAGMPAINRDGIVWIISGQKICKITKEGLVTTLSPNIGNEVFMSGPVISNDGVAYLGTESGTLYAINLDGSIKWYIKLGAELGVPVIGKQGTIYVLSADGYLHAIGN
jgi:serine/threonine protein kinase